MAKPIGEGDRVEAENLETGKKQKGTLRRDPQTRTLRFEADEDQEQGR